MSTKKCLLAWLLGFLAMFILSGIWYMLIMEEFYKTHCYISARESPLMAYIALGYVVLALLMAYLYPIGYKDGPPAREGFRFGALIGVLWILPYSLVLYGATNSGTRMLILVDTIWHIVEQGIGGIVIGTIYGRIAPSTIIK